MEVLSTWELFLLEIKRNISPKKDKIEKQFNFLKEKKLCDESTYNKLVEVRYIAAFEAAIVDFLHPPIEWKIGNVKAEILHLGTIYEGLMEIVIKNKFKDQVPKQLTFAKLIEFAKKEKIFKTENIINKIDELRKERNKIHLNNILPSDVGEVSSEEFRAIEFRNKLDVFIEEIKEIFKQNEDVNKYID